MLTWNLVLPSEILQSSGNHSLVTMKLWETLYLSLGGHYFVNSFRGTGTRSSHRRCSVKKDVLWNLAIFTGKHFCWSLFLMKLQAFRQHERDSNTGVFLWILRNSLRTPVLKNVCERLLLWCFLFYWFFNPLMTEAFII